MVNKMILNSDLNMLMLNDAFVFVDDNHKPHRSLASDFWAYQELPALSKHEKPKKWSTRRHVRRKKPFMIRHNGSLTTLSSFSSSAQFDNDCGCSRPFSHQENKSKCEILAIISNFRFIDTSSPVGVRKPSRFNIDVDRRMCSASE